MPWIDINCVERSKKEGKNSLTNGIDNKREQKKKEVKSQEEFVTTALKRNVIDLKASNTQKKKPN